MCPLNARSMFVRHSCSHPLPLAFMVTAVMVDSPFSCHKHVTFVTNVRA